jgi:hypothetical protein
MKGINKPGKAVKDNAFQRLLNLLAIFNGAGSFVLPWICFFETMLLSFRPQEGIAEFDLIPIGTPKQRRRWRGNYIPVSQRLQPVDWRSETTEESAVYLTRLPKILYAENERVSLSPCLLPIFTSQMQRTSLSSTTANVPVKHLPLTFSLPSLSSASCQLSFSADTSRCDD